MTLYFTIIRKIFTILNLLLTHGAKTETYTINKSISLYIIIKLCSAKAIKTLLNYKININF